ncbi:hypothetical protein [Ekhidna sp. To15]|uniref:hypothetical protein n=1 Tax=Ekhidna sp. To15 TaxID=3395267 RepID=UPI003F51ECF2
MCKKMGLSQQRLADLMDIKRGKVAGYFYETQAKSTFHQKLSEQFNLNLGKFLTLEMNDLNFETFFDSSTSAMVNEPAQTYGKSGAIELLQKAKNADSDEQRNKFIDEAIILYERLFDRNSELKDELIAVLKKDLE